jgi:hypothetical protein
VRKTPLAYLSSTPNGAVRHSCESHVGLGASVKFNLENMIC